MYNINWFTLIANNLAANKRWPFRLDLLHWLIAFIRQLHSEFLQYRSDTIFILEHDSRIVYFERLLNELFDPSPYRIYITTNEPISQLYLYQESEAKPIRLYREWYTGPYIVGEFAVQNNVVYKCAVANTDKSPAIFPTYWTDEGPVPYITRESEQSITQGFIVHVPSALIGSFDELVMRAWIDRYKLATKVYDIVYF